MTHIPHILDMHVEDAAILWLRRSMAVNAPNYAPMYLGRLDELLEAHLDGLRVAGDAGWEAAKAGFDGTGEPGEMFTLAVLAFGSDNFDWIRSVLEAVAVSPTTLVKPIAAAIGWLPTSALHGKVDPLLDDPNPVNRLVGIGACSVHRVDPGKRLAGYLRQAPMVRQAALKLVGELGRADLVTDVTTALPDDTPACTFRRALTATLIGDRGKAPETLLATAATGGDHARLALDVGLRAVGPVRARQWLAGLKGNPIELWLKIWGAGAVGDPAAMSWLISRMRDGKTAQAAGEAMTLITGWDLDVLDLSGDAPPDAPTGPTDDPADPNVDLDPDESLPFPDADRVTAFWADHGSSLPAGPLFLGQPVSIEGYQRAFANSSQRHRRAAAYGLALGSLTAPLPNWKTRQPKTL